MNKIYIFVLCPPFQGSTIIVELLNSSNKVTSFLNSPTKSGESQWLYKKHGDKQYIKNRWNPEYKLDMNMVNNVFNFYLNKKKEIYVEKSPPTICRAKMFEEYFSKLGKVYFIISIRNPYSTRYNANQWVKFAKYQKFNIENLKNTIVINYEDFCNDIDKVKSKIINEIPELGDLIYNEVHSKRVDLIIEKEKKNKILKKNKKLLKFFGYNIIS